MKHLLSAAVELAPSLREFEIVETWCGLRPDTLDHLPIIGPSGIDNLLLATGHFRNGILLAPITAKSIHRLIDHGKVSDDVIPFGIGRLEGGEPRARPSTLTDDLCVSRRHIKDC
jgi:glycine/D-amino acid oxidase-like deaminating enzyme